MCVGDSHPPSSPHLPTHSVAPVCALCLARCPWIHDKALLPACAQHGVAKGLEVCVGDPSCPLHPAAVQRLVQDTFGDGRLVQGLTQGDPTALPELLQLLASTTPTLAQVCARGYGLPGGGGVGSVC